MKLAGYVPNLEYALLDVREEQKLERVCPDCRRARSTSQAVDKEEIIQR